MKKVIYTDTFRYGGIDGAWGYKSFKIEDFVKILAGGLIEGAKDVEFHWNTGVMEMRLTTNMTEEESIGEDIKELETQIEKKKQQLEEYLKRKNENKVN